MTGVVGIGLERVEGWSSGGLEVCYRCSNEEAWRCGGVLRECRHGGERRYGYMMLWKRRPASVRIWGCRGMELWRRVTGVRNVEL